jgi:hypothetical protein
MIAVVVVDGNNMNAMYIQMRLFFICICTIKYVYMYYLIHDKYTLFYIDSYINLFYTAKNKDN